MDSGSLTGLDYRIMDLYQTGTSIENALPLEFTVATVLAPEDEYFVSLD